MITLNGHKIDVTIFPDGTSQVWKIGGFVQDDENVVIWDFDRRESELFHLKQLKALIDHIIYNRSVEKCKSKLIMPYLPYARQDKRLCDNETFALKVFADEINSQGWDVVQAFDTHNTWGTKAVINNFRTILPDLSFAENYDIVIFPDAGAADRYKVQDLTSDLENPPTILIGDKVRNPDNGYITSYQIDATKVKGKHVLVIDDLCDGGMTFKILGKELGDAAQADLYVSHGLFSKGLLDLLEIYDKIITTDSMVHLMDWDKTNIIEKMYVTRIPNGELKQALGKENNRFEVRKLDIRN